MAAPFPHPPHAQSADFTVPCLWQPIKLQQMPSRRAVRDTFIDTQSAYGVYCHMPKAKLVFHTRYVDEQGGLVEMKAYDVPKTQSTPHGFKYSLVYIFKGQRLVGYDNHEHKGDHRHFRATATSYVFTTVDRLIEDFRRDMAAVKKEIRR